MRGKSQEQSSPVGEQSTVIIMTGDEITDGSSPVREVRKEGVGLGELSSSQLGSFHSLHSSQSSRKDKMIPYVPPLDEVRVL